MPRWFLKTLLKGLTDKIETVTWIREDYTPIVEEKIKIVSPNNGEIYEVGDKIATSNDNNYTKNNIIVKKDIITTKRYRLKKAINGIEVVPVIYKNNGEIYIGETSTASDILEDNLYDISLKEK